MRIEHTSAATERATFLFCDLVGSTDLLSRLGNDGSEKVRRRYFAVLREAVRAAHGEEVKNTGDGLMVTFRAAATDAVACAIAMQRSMQLLNVEDPSLPLALRVGLAMGDASWAPEEDDWFGPAVNIAARLCAVAESGQILATADTAPDIAADGELQLAIRELHLKGIPRPVSAVAINWEWDDVGTSFSPVLAIDEGPPFVGRALELAALSRAWKVAEIGPAQFVKLSGDPGSGKTRLARELASRVASGGGTVLYGRCRLDAAGPFDVFTEAFRWWLAANGPGQSKKEVARLLDGSLSSFPSQGRVTTDHLRTALDSLLHEVTARTPVLLVVDDIHHAQAETLDLLAKGCLRAGGRLMVLALMREDGPNWRRTLERLPGTLVHLPGLTEADIAALVADLVNGPPAGLSRVVFEHTAGNAGQVVDAVRTLSGAGKLDLDAAAGLVEHLCPYRGLAPFRPADHTLFFGREGLVAALLDRLARSRVLGVLGPSGSGKSSLVLAGLLPALARGALPGSERWQVAVCVPGQTPYSALAGALAALPPISDAPATIEQQLERSPHALDSIARAAVRGPDDRLVLIIDQFEELLMSADGASDTAAFADLLLRAVDVPGGPLSLVVVLRADFYGHLVEHPELAAALKANHALVGPMNQLELAEAVRQPAFIAGLRVEDSLVEAVVHDVAGQAGALPLLSHALRETWRRREGRVLTLAGYRDAGEVRGAIAQSAEAVVASIGQWQEPTVRRLFLRLVNLGEGAEDTRRRAELAELPGDQEALVPHLVDARLLTIDETTVEVAHEALIREWPRLRAWLDEDREGLRLHRHLTAAATAWDESGRDHNELYRGPRLQTALTWATLHQPDLNRIEGAFLDAGRELREREQHSLRRTNSRLRRLLAGIGVLAVLALVAAIVAVTQQHRARAGERTARAATRSSDLNRLIAQSKVEAKGQTDLSTLLALEANRLDDSADTQATILNALMGDSRWLGSYGDSGGSAGAGPVALTPGGALVRVTNAGVLQHWDATTQQPLGPDIQLAVPGGKIDRSIVAFGRTVFALSAADTVRVYDLSTGAPVGPLIRHPIDGDDRTERPLELSPDETVLYVAGGPGSSSPNTGFGVVSRFDVHTGALLGPPWRGHTAGINALRLSPDGRRLATGGRDANIIVWDTATGAPVLPPLQGHRSALADLAWSPDGSTLASASWTPPELVLWDSSQGSLLRRTALAHAVPVTIAYGPGGVIATAGPEGRVDFWDASTLAPARKGLQLHGAALGPVFAPDGKSIFVTGERPSHWALDGSSNLGTLVAGGAPENAWWSPDGRLLALAGLNGPVELFDAASKASLGPLPDPPPESPFTRAVAFSPDGRSLAVTGGQGLQVYDLSSRTVRFKIAGNVFSQAYRIAFSPDSHLIAVGGRQGVVLYDSATGAMVDQPISIPMMAGNSAGVIPTFSPDGRLLYIYPFLQPLSIYDLQEHRMSVKGETPIQGFDVTPDGRQLAAGLLGGKVALLNADTAQPIGQPIVVGAQEVFVIRFTNGARRLITYALDQVARVVDLGTRQVFDPGFPSGMVQTILSTSPDGQLLALPADHGTVLWDIDPQRWRQRACEVVGRNLTRYEWAKYMPNSGLYRKTCDQWPLQRTP